MSRFAGASWAGGSDGQGGEMTDWNNFSLTVASASLLIPFMLEDADDDWDEVTEQLQAIQWGDGMGTWK